MSAKSGQRQHVRLQIRCQLPASHGTDTIRRVEERAEEGGKEHDLRHDEPEHGHGGTNDPSSCGLTMTILSVFPDNVAPNQPIIINAMISEPGGEDG